MPTGLERDAAAAARYLRRIGLEVPGMMSGNKNLPTSSPELPTEGPELSETILAKIGKIANIASVDETHFRGNDAYVRPRPFDDDGVLGQLFKGLHGDDGDAVTK